LLLIRPGRHSRSQWQGSSHITFGLWS